MAKLSSASIRLVMKKNRKMSSGEYPIYIVVCFSGRLEKSTGVSCLERYWDAKREVIKSGCPNAPVLNKILNDIKSRVIDRKNDFIYNNKVYTPSMLLEDIQVDFNGKSNVFIDLVNRLIEERRLKFGTIRSYDYCYKKLCEYFGRDKFLIDELTLGVCKDFAKWLEENNIKINTVKRLLSCMASVWNYAISKKIVDASGYPFSEFKYTVKYKDVHRDYYLDKSHIIRLRDYWMGLCIEENGNLWRFKDGIEDRLMVKSSKEFGILYWILCYRFGGMAPVDVAYLRPNNFERVYVAGEDHWKISFRRKKTNVAVTYLVKRDLLSLITIDYFLGRCGHFVYPIIDWYDGMSDKEILESCHYVAKTANRHVRRAFKAINEMIIADNVRNNSNEPIVEVDKVVMYSARHSRASNYFNTPGATIGGLASMLGRSANTIATYAHYLTKNEELVEIDKACPI